MIQDLSHRHEMLGSLFLPTEEDRSWKLSDDQVAFFHEHGYLTGVRLLSDAQVEALREELGSFFTPNHAGRELWYEYNKNESADPNTVLFHALGAWRITPSFHDVLWSRRFTTAAAQLLDGPVRFWHDQLFCKPAKHGGVVAWHQDYSYWTRTIPMAHLTCWIGLDDSTVDNGCVHYVPGSHRWDLLPITGLAGDMDAIKAVLDDQQWEQFCHPVAAEVKLGEASFHHPLTVHGSFENRTERPRRATVINTVRDGVCSDDDQPLLNGTMPIGKGEPLGGQFYPRLTGT
jgi:ectoine hydroxylase-related dioxygenase (phytanoyl-CoA dioxygenase family)